MSEKDKSEEYNKPGIYDPQTSRDYAISGVTNIGRNRDSNQIVLGIGEDGRRTQDPELRDLLLRISRNHALITPSRSSPGRYKVVDLGGNGTYVEKNGKFILVDKRGVRLSDNDKIHFGGDPNIEKTYTLVFNPEKKKGHRRLDDIAGGISGIFILSGLVFLYGTLTGNAISNLGQNLTRFMGIALISAGLVFGFIWLKLRIRL